ncbi:MAG: spermine synthase [Candidatus Latescibacteria bacterium]|nr:spermine synthase [Candidatus Latescibacterota bacterium]
MPAIVLSHIQTAPLVECHRQGLPSTTLSPDLGLSTVTATLTPVGVHFPDQPVIAWDCIEEINSHPTCCFAVSHSQLERLQQRSPITGRLCGLWPTAAAPALVIDGTPMHRIKGIDPSEDTRRKLKPLHPLKGPLLDTATGLGYTAIAASQRTGPVFTAELDPCVAELAGRNPWSTGLFDTDRITRLEGDIRLHLPDFAEATFSRILHDPPAFNLAGELYAQTLYDQLHRLLRANGRLFHYIGNPDSPSGQRVTRGVVRRLHQAGFSRVQPRPEAFGVLAYK